MTHKAKVATDTRGFTIVELLLAMTFFSFILIFFSYGFVQINRTFQRGQTIKRVTQSGRAVIEDMSRNIRISSTDTLEIISDDVTNRLCLSNGVHYGWNRVVGGGTEQLVSETAVPIGPLTLAKSEVQRPTCAEPFVQYETPQTVTSGGASYLTQGITSLLDDGVVVQDLDIEILPTNDAIRIDLILSADSVGSLSGAGDTATCNGFINKGSEYCDVVRFATIVNFRLD